MNYQAKFFFHAPNGNATHAYLKTAEAYCLMRFPNAYRVTKLQITRLRSFLSPGKSEIRMPECVISDEKGKQYVPFLYEGETYLKPKECADNA